MASWVFWFHYLIFQLLELHHGGKAATLHLRPFRILFIKHRYNQKAACQNLAMECPSRKTRWDRKKRQAPYKLKFQHETASPNLPWGVWTCSQLPPLPKHHLQDASQKALSGMHLWVAGFAGTKSLVWRSLVFFSQVYIWLCTPKNFICSLYLKNTMSGAMWVPISSRCWLEEDPSWASSLPATQKPKYECKKTQDRVFRV